jgi:hypothetical protein
MTVEEKEKWFSRALKFALDGKIHLIMKSNMNGAPRWSIIDTEKNMVLNSNLEWEAEPPKVKDRNEGFLLRARFDLDTAISLYDQYKMFAQ